MKSLKNSLLILFLLSTTISFSQNGLELVYSNTLVGIRQFNSFKLFNDDQTKVFIQTEGGEASKSGTYYKLNKSTNVLEIPYNGLLNVQYSDLCNGYYYNIPIETFVMSPKQEQTVIYNTRTTCDSVFNDTTRYTLNGGNNVFKIHLINCAGFDISINDSIFFTAGSNDLISYNIYKSTNRGLNWFMTDTLQNLKRLSKGGFLKCNPFFPNIIYATGKDSILVSTNSGYSFVNSNAPAFQQICFDYNNHSLYGIWKSRIYKSTNNGILWNLIYTSPNVEFNCLQVSYDDSNILYAGTSYGVYLSTNSGLNWSIYNNAFAGSKSIIGISKDPGMNSTLYACTKTGLYKVLNSYYQSQTFKSHFKVGNYFEYFQDDFQTQYFSYFVYVEKDTVLSNGLKYFKLRISGSQINYTYENIDTVTLRWFKYDPGCPNADDFGNSTIIYFQSELGDIFNQCSYAKKVTAKGVSNNILGDPTSLKYSTVYYHPFFWHGDYNTYAEKFGYLGATAYSFRTFLRGAIVNGTNYGIIQSGIKSFSNRIPDVFLLHPNYPNPFNPTTKIKFDLPQNARGETQDVKLVVFDALGREVATLVNEKLAPGSYEVEFNGRNFLSGIYFFKLTAGEFTEVRRMILLK